MKLNAREEIAAPVEDVFGMLLCFDRFERIAAERGLAVQRRAGTGDGALGTVWDLRTELFGKMLDLRLEVTRIVPPEALSLTMTSPGIVGSIDCTLDALSADRTRMHLSIEMLPQTLGARLLLKPLQLAHASVNERFGDRVSRIVRQIETETAGNGPNRPEGM